ncbi:hypothetical protein F6S34_24850 [Escherichia coli]|uniref:Uncharacterized protein n=1 Tax=Escherichia coli O25b:H4 TaxID=941280 RepID=A0A7I0KV28_ECO25|nr:hypothetical protein [Escherichia coli]TLI47535.1 hypothetical protein EWT58_21775 [Escherichia coli O25b:H4]MBW9878267.1 hypothetical protein [Escherichia coli]TLI67247.1 hypothetical protein EWT59_13755 [Escherichia coli O25b:H4]HAG7875900.1 hypothetical protein [Escherichia coli]
MRWTVTRTAHTTHVISTSRSSLASPKCRTNNHNLMNIKENMIFHHEKNINVSLYKNNDNMT